MKKILALLLTVILIFSVGCSKQPVNNSSVIDTSNVGSIANAISDTSEDKSNENKFDEDLEVNNPKKPPDEKFIINDLKKNGINGFQLNYCYEILNVNTLDIIKRKTDDEVDTVYISVVFKNSSYTVNADITLYYSFYTVGGWILDYHEITDYQSFANIPLYTDDEWLVIINENFNDGKILNRYQHQENNGVFYDEITFSGYLEYNYAKVNIKCKYTMCFDSNVWNEYGFFEDVNVDWSKTIGTFKYTNNRFHWSLTWFETDVSVNIVNIEQLTKPQEYGYENGVSITYGIDSYFYSTTDQEIWTNEKVPLKTRNIETRVVTETIMGMQLDIPIIINHTFFIPFNIPGFAKESLEAKFNVNDGIYSDELENYKKVFFEKI